MSSRESPLGNNKVTKLDITNKVLFIITHYSRPRLSQISKSQDKFIEYILSPAFLQCKRASVVFIIANRMGCHVVTQYLYVAEGRFILGQGQAQTIKLPRPSVPSNDFRCIQEFTRVNTILQQPSYIGYIWMSPKLLCRYCCRLQWLEFVFGNEVGSTVCVLNTSTVVLRVCNNSTNKPVRCCELSLHVQWAKSLPFCFNSP